MNKALHFIILPPEITDFERQYLARVNRVALFFFAMHVPALALIAFVNGTGAGLAALLSLAVFAGPAIAYATLRNPRWVSVVFGVTAMFMGGLLVHFGQGPVQIEMHFYFFSLIAMCAVFGNPLVIVAAAVTVALHHLLVWLILPRSVFNYEAAWWVVAVHAAFVVLESVAACFISRSFFDNVIRLETIVQTRTRALDSKNRDMRLLLDNVQQGFLTIDRQGHLAKERSAAVDQWFGAPGADVTWFDYLGSLSPEFAKRTRLAWDEVIADVMPAELTLEQMPHRITLKGTTHFRIDYRPIGTTGPAENYLVIVTDVTSDVEREHAECEAREAMEVFQRVLVDRSGFETFFEEGSALVHSLAQEKAGDLGTIKRLIHTLKGNSSLYGLTSIAVLCHQLEDGIEQASAAPAPGMYEPLSRRWGRLTSDMEHLLGQRAHTVEIDDQQFAALEAAARADESPTAMVRRVRGLRLEPAGRRLKHFEEQVRRLAERLEKPEVQVEVNDAGVRLDPRRWAAFWSSFVHAIRNAVDHGLEPAAVRLAAGKSARGNVLLRAYEEKDRIVLEIADDGKGIDWEALAERAKAKGLAAQTEDDLKRALFTEGVSTAENVTDLSGRGVGMGALLEGTRALGGDVSVDSTPGKGTTLRFTFPTSAGRSADSLAPAAARN